MDEILRICRARGISVVEDNAHGIFGEYKGKPLGSFGDLATLSFHETKNISCGEGGALLINDIRWASRAEIIREKGTNRSRFFRGQVDKYSWVDLGSSYLPSDILAAFLWAQLEASREIQEARRRIWLQYAHALHPWARSMGASIPFVPADCQQAYHMFYLILPDGETRTRLIAFLRERGILAVFHYLPLHLSEMGQRFGGRTGDCPVTESISDRLVRLPFFAGLCPDDQSRVIEAVLSFST